MSQYSETLFEQDNFIVSKCHNSGKVGLLYQNMLVAFDEIDFDQFIAGFDKINFFQESIIFPDRTAKIVLETSHNNIQFCLEEDEFQEMRNMINQVGLLLEARKLI